MNNIQDDLRQKAKEMLSISSADVTNMSTHAIQELLYEFQVHQLELELQNEELRRIQHELEIANDHYVQFYNLLPIAYLTLDETGTILENNLAATKLLEIQGKALIGKKLGQFVNPLDQDNYFYFIQAILNNRSEQLTHIRLSNIKKEPSKVTCHGVESYCCTTENCFLNDNSIYLECQGDYKIDQHGQIQISLLLSNVTDEKLSGQAIECLNKKLEQKIFTQTKSLFESHQEILTTLSEVDSYKRQLTEQEKMLNVIFNTAMEGIITIILSGKIVFVNDTVEKIFAYKKEELINNNINLLIPILKHKNHASHFRVPDDINPFIANNSHEITAVRKDGSTLPLEISIAQFSIDGINLTCSVRDITDRKIREQRDQEHLDELAHVTRLGLMGEMASGIAHEVNQPLTAIANYSQACLNLLQKTDLDKDNLSDLLLKNRQQALKAGQIIHRMRDFARHKEIQHSTVDLNTLIQEAISLCGSYLKQNRITIQLQLAENLPLLTIDSIQIEQVILKI
jgi:PAS domain S-box-containing protein